MCKCRFSLYVLCLCGWVPLCGATVAVALSKIPLMPEVVASLPGVNVDVKSRPFQAAPKLNANWSKQMTAQMDLADRHYDTVILGDSITAGWNTAGKGARDTYFGDVLNLGIGGDRTEHLLWRIRQMQWDVISPKRLIVMIGTNNIGHAPADSPANIAGAIELIIKELKVACPQAQILLQAIFPRDVDASRPNQQVVAQTNALLAVAAPKWGVTYRDFGKLFLKADGKTLNRDVSPDLLHLNARGYEIWSQALVDTFGGSIYVPVPKVELDAQTAKLAALPRPYRAGRQIDPRVQSWWHKRFLSKLHQSHRPYDMVLLGDSITENWDNHSGDLRDRYFGNCLAFGFSGDRTEHVLWRLRHMPWDKLAPKQIVLMIGTNNMGFAPSDKAEDIAGAITQIVDELHVKCPQARILLLGIFPRAENKLAPMRQKGDAVNALISKLGERDYVDYRDLKSVFVKDDELETIRLDLMRDKLHPNRAGHDLWGKAVKDLILVK